ncbi:MAG TPA: hypothetical protein V6D27_00860 [Vampirovibrionales bacterium]
MSGQNYDVSCSTKAEVDKILSLIKSFGEVTLSGLAEEINRGKAWTSKLICRLEEEGKVTTSVVTAKNKNGMMEKNWIVRVK